MPLVALAAGSLLVTYYLVKYRGRPQVRAEEIPPRTAMQQENLRRIAVRCKLVGIARLEFGDNAVGKEVPIAGKAGEQRRTLRDAVLVTEVDATFVEARGDFREVITGTGRRIDQAGHDAASLLPRPEKLS